MIQWFDLVSGVDCWFKEDYSDFFFFAAAFEVYVRRAYRAYTLLSIDYEEGDTLDDGEAPTAVTWRFNLGESHSPPSTPNIVGYVWFLFLSH